MIRLVIQRLRWDLQIDGVGARVRVSTIISDEKLKSEIWVLYVMAKHEMGMNQNSTLIGLMGFQDNVV